MVLLNILVSSLFARVHCGLSGQKWLISFKNLLLIISIFFFISVWEVLEGGEEVAPGRVRAGALFNENQSHREDSHCSTTLLCTSNEQKDRIFSAARCRCSNEKKAMQCITPMAGCALLLWRCERKSTFTREAPSGAGEAGSGALSQQLIGGSTEGAPTPPVAIRCYLWLSNHVLPF